MTTTTGTEVFKTSEGWILVKMTKNRLTVIDFPVSKEEAMNKLKLSDKGVISQELIKQLQKDFNCYFKGEKVDFLNYQLDFSGLGEFTKKVLQKTREIPYGETWSYKRIAEQISCPKGARAVGQALGRNPLPMIIPCHRVISKNGSLGGFSGGLDWKKKLLKLEAN